MGVSIVCDNYCPACVHLRTRMDSDMNFTSHRCNKYGETVYASDFDRAKEFERELPVKQFKLKKLVG